MNFLEQLACESSYILLSQLILASMRISVALCTYNGEKFLAEQLQSLANQTRLPDELIICDDASSDSTVDIINAFIKTAPFTVRFFSNETNLGSTLNFEKSIRLCQGDLIFLCDQDDIWFSNKIAIIEREFLLNEKIGMIFTDAELIDENSNKLGHNLWYYYFPAKKRKEALNSGIYRVLIDTNVVTGATMAFRSRFREAFLPIPLDLPNTIHDGWIALAMSILSEVKFIECPLIQYRLHHGQQLGLGSLSAKNTNESVRSLEFLLRHQKKYSLPMSQTIDLLHKDIQRLYKIEEVISRYPHIASRFDFGICLDEPIKRKFEYILHLENRLKLPENRIKRLLPIMRELLSGRYKRFSKGIMSAIKDFIIHPSKA